jgi:hypothetical protein
MNQVVEVTKLGVGIDPEVVSVVTTAYQMATDHLRRDGYTDLVRDIIANKIIDTAQQGERDPEGLCRSALAALGIRE